MCSTVAHTYINVERYLGRFEWLVRITFIHRTKRNHEQKRDRERTLCRHTQIPHRMRSIIIVVCTWFLMPRDLFIQRFKDVFVFFSSFSRRLLFSDRQFYVWCALSSNDSEIYTNHLLDYTGAVSGAEKIIHFGNNIFIWNVKLIASAI